MVQLYCWGDGSSGQLGGRTSLSPVSWSFSGAVRDISCGEQHTLFLSEDGDVLSCGQHSQGRLGRKKSKDVKKPGPVVGLGGIVSIACGRAHNLALSASGHVFSWGAKEDGQLGIPPKQRHNNQIRIQVEIPITVPVVQVACGNSHSLALTKGGDVFTWGRNTHGQLGLGKKVPLQHTPARVTALTGVAVTQISAGATHSFFLTLPGLVYCCGANKSGQLGLNRVDVNGSFDVCEVSALRPLDVSVISCGEAHSAVLTKDGKIFTFGEGSHGQLGHNSTENENCPRLVEGLDEPATQISCGRYHTVVLGSSGQLWAFGHGAKGQTGTGGTEDSLTPTLVELPWTKDGEAAAAKGLKISAGWNTNFVFSAPAQSANKRQTTGRLDEAKLHKWLTATTNDAETKREINAMFSSCSSLVTSFTKADCHLKEAGALTVDLEAASQTFDQLLEVPWLKQSIKMDLQDLLVVDLKSPEVILLLLTCPLLQEDNNVRNMLLLLANVVADLSQKNHQTLKSLWSSLTPSLLTRQILGFKKALGFMVRKSLDTTHIREAKNLLKALKVLYEVNRKGKSYKVPLSTFHVEEIALNVNPTDDVILRFDFSKVKDDENTPVIFSCYPFVLPLDYRVLLCKAPASMEKDPLSVFYMGPADNLHLVLRRSHLVEDVFKVLGEVDQRCLRYWLSVQYTDDMTVMNVNRSDLFLHVFDELIDPESQMFIYNESKTLLWFPAKPKVEKKKYFLFGVLCGLAVNNNNLIHLPFPLVLFKKLLHINPTLDDLKEFDPVMGESFRYLLEDCPPGEVESLDSTFSVFWDGEVVELDPKEPEKLVTASNREEFVNAFVNHAFNKSVKKVFKEFKRGFFKVCEFDMAHFFLPEELQTVMVGQENYDWDVFKKNTAYECGYYAKHPNIITFWEVFQELTAEDKKRFLLFLTGVDHVPFRGMKSIRMKVFPLFDDNEKCLPESLTCHKHLFLPLYPGKKTMQTRLRRAIYNNSGFRRTDTTQEC